MTNKQIGLYSVNIPGIGKTNLAKAGFGLAAAIPTAGAAGVEAAGVLGGKLAARKAAKTAATKAAKSTSYKFGDKAIAATVEGGAKKKGLIGTLGGAASSISKSKIPTALLSYEVIKGILGR